MSKPEDIPEDVWDSAFYHMDDFALLTLADGDDEVSIQQCIARAILSERTKAAELYKALREIAAHEPSDGNHNLNDLIAHASVKTASQAIRKGGKE